MPEYVSHVHTMCVCFVIVSSKKNWVVVSFFKNVHPYLGKIPILTNMFQMG